MAQPRLMLSVVTVLVRGPAGEVQTERFAPAYRALHGDAIELVGDSAPGRRVSIRIPVELIEDVPADDQPSAVSDLAREAEERVLASVLARQVTGVF